MFIEYNPNPVGNNVGDCVIRAITKAMDKTWEDTYIDIVVQGFLHSDMPSSNHVWDAYLRDNGFNRYIMPNFCPDCYTIRQFCYDHPKGTYILADNAMQTQALEQYLNPAPIPAYVVQNPNCCATPSFGCGCGAM